MAWRLLTMGNASAVRIEKTVRMRKAELLDAAGMAI